VSEESPEPSLFEELKRRNVVRVAAMYAVVGWLVVEVASTVLPTFKAPEWILQVLTFFVILGFPLALVLAWAFELTPEGIRRESDVDRASPENSVGRRGRNVIIVSLLAAALVFFLLDRFEPQDTKQTATATESKRSLAVLPFENMSQDANNEPFTIGIHDDLVTHISKINSIKTISRTSVLQYRDTTKTIPEIAAELGVATILEGGVQRAGDRVRINVQLIDAATDEHIWSETYDRQLTAANFFAIQSEISTSIAEALRVTLSMDEQQRLDHSPTESLAAVETYFLGKQLLEQRTRESLFAAVEYFEQVIELDPNFALGYSGLADAYMLLPEYVANIDAQLNWQKSEAAARSALALDPDLPEALASMGWNRVIHYYDWAGAEALLRRALAIQSNNSNALHWLSHVLSWQGQHEEAVELARRAVDIDPDSKVMGRNLAYILMDVRDFDDSIAIQHENLRRHPDAVGGWGNLWQNYFRAGRAADAAGTLQRWAALTNRDDDAAREVGEAMIRHAQTGAPQSLSRELVQRVRFGHESLGQVYAAVGDGPQTLDALERAYEARSGSRSVLSMKVNPSYDFIRDDPRFKTLMKRVGFAR
jgi:TolB-like protein/tetratricopeptide (TPR) repeat protein